MSAAADTCMDQTSALGRAETTSEVSVGGHVALGGASHFDPLPCLARDYKGVFLALG